MIERDVRGSTDESGEEGVAEDATNDLAKANGNVTTTTTTAVARNWNEVDLIDWGTSKSQETFAQPQAPHGGAGVEGTTSSHPENAAVVTPPPLQRCWRSIGHQHYRSSCCRSLRDYEIKVHGAHGGR